MGCPVDAYKKCAFSGCRDEAIRVSRLLDFCLDPAAGCRCRERIGNVGVRVVNDVQRRTIASRRLLYLPIGESEKRNLTVRIVGPYLLVQGSVGFAFDEGAAGCDIEFDGLSMEVISVYGADAIQALALATDIDPYLRGLSRKYHFFFETGEPYFDALS